MHTSTPKLSNTAYYHPLSASSPPHHHQQYVIVLPYSPTPTYSLTLLYKSCRLYLLLLLGVLLLCATAFLLYPSDPDVSIVRFHLSRLRIHTAPKISIDITLESIVKLFNRDFYSLDYNYVIVSVGYRGKQLGFVTSDHGHLDARASSYINATLQLDDIEVFADVIPLIEDFARGSVTFDTVMEVGGHFGIAWFEVPLKAKVSCEIIVNTHKQIITRQNCYNK